MANNSSGNIVKGQIESSKIYDTHNQRGVDNPNYILDFKDSIPVPKNETTAFLIIKKIYIVLLFIMLIDMIFFKDTVNYSAIE